MISWVQSDRFECNWLFVPVCLFSVALVKVVLVLKYILLVESNVNALEHLFEGET